MSDLYERILSRRSSLERLAARIPGLAEYLDKRAWQTADQMLRDYVASELRKRIDRFAALEKRLLDSNGLAFMSKTRGVKAKMQLFLERVKTAAPGYSGPFQRGKIRPEELEKLYNFDEAQIRFVDQFDDDLKAFEEAISGQQNVEAVIAQLNQVAVEANESCSRREAVLTQLSKSV